MMTTISSNTNFRHIWAIDNNRAQILMGQQAANPRLASDLSHLFSLPKALGMRVSVFPHLRPTCKCETIPAYHVLEPREKNTDDFMMFFQAAHPA